MSDTEQKTLRLITIGEILKPHGIGGEIKVKTYTETFDLFEDLGEVLVTKNMANAEKFIVNIESCRPHQKGVLLKLEGIETPEDIEKYRGWLLQIPQSMLPEPEEDEYYLFDFYGIEVYTASGDYVGKVTDIIPAGDSDVYEIKNKETEKVNLIPSRKEFIKSVDIKNKKMIIEPIDGLIEL